MRIDSHQHFGRYDAIRGAWITDAMSLLRRGFLPEHLARELRANGIDGTVAVQADQFEDETNFLLRLGGTRALHRRRGGLGGSWRGESPRASDVWFGLAGVSIGGVL